MNNDPDAATHPRQPIPLSEQISCVQRELGMRRAVYPRRVMAERMSATEAQRETCAMQAVLDTLRRLAAGPDLLDANP
jgi:hypothetical protein